MRITYQSPPEYELQNKSETQKQEIFLYKQET